MKHISLRLSLAIVSMNMFNPVFAAAFQFYELGTPIIGTAGVGQAAVANDASTSYFNPAGMTQLTDTQFMIGSQLILPYTHFSISPENTIHGNNGGEAASLTPGADFFYAYSFSPQLKFGVSFTTPYAGMLDYNDGWVGKFIVQDMTLYALNFNPAMAYKVNDWLSLGAGVSIEYANLQQTVSLPLTPLIDDQADIRVDNLAPGFNIGLMALPTATTKLGLAYRSEIVHKLRGQTTIIRIIDQPDTSTRMTMPQNIILSLEQKLTNKANLLGELGWANWSSMQNTVVNVVNYTETTTLNWKNTYRVGLGMQYQITDPVLLQTGASYDSSPTKASLRTPDMPMDRQIRLGAGLIYSVIPAIKLGFSYEYINFGKADIDNVSSNGILAGHYTPNYANIFQASINVTC